MSVLMSLSTETYRSLQYPSNTHGQIVLNFIMHAVLLDVLVLNRFGGNVLGLLPTLEDKYYD